MLAVGERLASREKAREFRGRASLPGQARQVEFGTPVRRLEEFDLAMNVTDALFENHLAASGAGAAEQHCGAHRRMPGERKLGPGCEDPQFCLVCTALGR